MTEWDVFLAIGAIAAFVGTVYKLSGIFNSLETSIKILTNEAKRLSEEMRETREDNKESHRRLWMHNEKQDEKISDHERRISMIEKVEEMEE